MLAVTAEAGTDVTCTVCNGSSTHTAVARGATGSSEAVDAAAEDAELVLPPFAEAPAPVAAADGVGVVRPLLSAGRGVALVELVLRAVDASDAVESVCAAAASAPEEPAAAAAAASAARLSAMAAASWSSRISAHVLPSSTSGEGSPAPPCPPPVAQMPPNTNTPSALADGAEVLALLVAATGVDAPAACEADVDFTGVVAPARPPALPTGWVAAAPGAATGRVSFPAAKSTYGCKTVVTLTGRVLTRRRWPWPPLPSSCTKGTAT